MKLLQKDEITPTEKSIFNRYKECFGFNDSEQFSKLFNVLVKEQEFTIENDTIELQKFKIEEEQYQGLVFKNQKWVFSDYQDLQIEDQENWNLFIKFLQNYFDKENNLLNSSVMNINSKNKKQFININKIPGGKYGCIQLIYMKKIEKLSQLSVGKLSSFVQHAVNKMHLLVYYKFYIIKAKNVNFEEYLNLSWEEQLSYVNREYNNSSVNISVMTDNNNKKYVQVKFQILQIMYDLNQQNITQINIAKLPYYLNINKVQVNYIQLGFHKMINLIQSISEIEIVENNNNRYIQLQKDFIENYEKEMKKLQYYIGVYINKLINQNKKILISDLIQEFQNDLVHQYQVFTMSLEHFIEWFCPMYQINNNEIILVHNYSSNLSKIDISEIKSEMHHQLNGSQITNSMVDNEIDEMIQNNQQKYKKYYSLYTNNEDEEYNNIINMVNNSQIEQ